MPVCWDGHYPAECVMVLDGLCLPSARQPGSDRRPVPEGRDGPNKPKQTSKRNVGSYMTSD